MNFLARWLLTAVAVLLTAWLVPGIGIVGNGLLAAVWTALALAFVNAWIKPVLETLALPLTVSVFVGSFIPRDGATAAGVLAALIALVANGPVVALIVVVVIIAVNQIEGNFLQPVVMGKSLSIHGLVILLALTAGTILAGIIGAILAVPLAAVAWAIVKVWTGEDTGNPEDVAEMPEPESQPESQSLKQH